MWGFLSVIFRWSSVEQDEVEPEIETSDGNPLPRDQELAECEASSDARELQVSIENLILEKT